MPLSSYLLTAALLALCLDVSNAKKPAPAPVPAPSVAPVKKFEFRVTAGPLSPDCFERPVLLVNNQLSPTIDINQGDILQVRNNQL